MKLSKLLATTGLIAASTLATSAFAGVINTYSFYDSSAGPYAGPYANIGTSEVFTGSNGLQATATFFEGVDKNNGSGGTAVDGYWGHGLGVIGATGSSSVVDNDGEAILFSFGSTIIGTDATFYGSSNNRYDTDVRVFAWDSGSWDEVTYHAFGGFNVFSLNGVETDKLLFVNVDYTNGNDTWVLKGLTVETTTSDTVTEVPEPGSLALLGLGLAGLGLSRRRQKQA